MNAEVLGEAFQVQAVGFAFFPQQVGMGLTQDNVNDVGKLADDFRQRPQGKLDALVG